VLNLPYAFLWRPRSSRIICTCRVSKLAAQRVTSTPLENPSLLLYMNLRIKILILALQRPLFYTLGRFFFRGGHITKIWSNKIFFMKTLSKLGVLTVLFSFKLDSTVMFKSQCCSVHNMDSHEIINRQNFKQKSSLMI
jgi:hypothetical protein